MTLLLANGTRASSDVAKRAHTALYLQLYLKQAGFEAAQYLDKEKAARWTEALQLLHSEVKAEMVALGVEM